VALLASKYMEEARQSSEVNSFAANLMMKGDGEVNSFAAAAA
jgi:hypothetical protein